MRNIRIGLSCFILLLSSVAYPQCSVATVRVKGKVEHDSTQARVRVQLIYPKQEHEESAEADVEAGAFNIPVDFLTEGRRGLINNLGQKCNRKPKTVVITLMKGGQEYDRVFLDFVRDFEKSDPSAYMVKREVVLQGQQP